MKRFIFLVTLLMPTAIFVSGQSTEEKSVRKTLDELAVAMKNKDVVKLDRIYANDYTFVSPSSGIMSNKSERIAAVKSGKPLEYLTYEDKKVRIYGNTAVVTSTVKSKYAGQDNAQSKVTLTMVKNNGRWQMVAGHATAITANQAEANEEQTLIQIEQELVDALVKGDVSANEKYLADAYIFTAPDGAIMNKGQGIADLKSGDLKFESSKLDDMKVQFYGSTAVVTYRTTDAGNYKGNDLSGQYRWTDVFVKQGGRWQIVAGHGTRIAQVK